MNSYPPEPPNPDNDGDGVPDDDIVITGTRPREYDPIGGGDPGTGVPGGSTGGTGGTSSNGSQPIAPHPGDCSSANGAAVDVAKAIKGEPTGEGPPDPITTSSGGDWTSREFGAVITKTSVGKFGALNDAIYSNDSSDVVILPSAAGTPSMGFLHNHSDTGNVQENNIARYPSYYANATDDWQALANFKQQVAPNDPSFDPSIWIMDSNGVVREFKLSEREYYEDLAKNNVEGMEAEDGAGLADKERTNPC